VFRHAATLSQLYVYLITFQDEFRKLLEAHGIAYDERCVWD
jgi:hypothetical protein